MGKILDHSKTWVDFHIHTTKSDGTFSPLETLIHAKNIGLGCISITDHDTLEGTREIQVEIRRSQEQGIRIVSGIEISAKFTSGALHILGYGMDIDNLPLKNKLNEFKEIRKKRNLSIIEKLNQLGFDINENDILKQSRDNESQGRPHIAKMLLDKGVVKTVNEAFEVFLGQGKKAYIEKKLVTAEVAIKLISDAGGKAFLAHPTTLKLDDEAFKIYLKKLMDYGLRGIEVFTPHHSPTQVTKYQKIALKNRLLISAGSDFHGTIKPDVVMGQCFLGKKVSAETVSDEIFNCAPIVS